MQFKVILGLGNPENEYGSTYHNVGKVFTRYFAEKMGQPVFFPSKYCRMTKGNPLRFALSDVYMNESGKAAKFAVTHPRVGTKELLVAHDDADIPVGSYRISFGRGTAGHNGVRSVIEHLGTKDFWRLRIGVRKEATGHVKAGAYVLRPVSAHDTELISQVFGAAGASITKLMEKENP